jgi:hypothetical protein
VSSDWFLSEPLDENVEELNRKVRWTSEKNIFILQMEFSEDDYVNNSLFRELEEISRWHRLKRITLVRGVFIDEK